MPLYEYQCERCGVRFERYQPMSAEPIDACPECAGHAHRVISPVGVIFRGSGFYVTDNRAKSSGASRGKESKPNEKIDKGSAETVSTTEAKPSSSSGDGTE
jgi:putative FmdB family regulatory protein